jgi:endonuclease-3
MALILAATRDNISFVPGGEQPVATTSVGSRARELLKTLRRRYPRKSAPPSGELINHLAAVIIGRDAEPDRAYRACHKLLADFVDWNEVRVARWGEVERVLRPYVGDRSGEAARRLIQCLQQVFLIRGNVNLSAAAETSPTDTRQFLLGLELLDRDEGNLVLLLGLGEPVMPVDSDVLRASKRLGVIANSATKLQAQRALEQSLEGEDLHACYVALREHARRVCFTDSPECPSCTVRKQCRHSSVQ